MVLNKKQKKKKKKPRLFKGDNSVFTELYSHGPDVTQGQGKYLIEAMKKWH